MVESNDSDVVILLLFYFKDFRNNGLNKMWIHYGKGKSACFLPLHIMFEMLGAAYCHNLLKSHIRTGCDNSSKIGTKKSALTADPERHLKEFGEAATLNDEKSSLAEHYLKESYLGFRAIKAAKRSPNLTLGKSE